MVVLAGSRDSEGQKRTRVLRLTTIPTADENVRARDLSADKLFIVSN